jgi:hypothetical protein
VDPRRDGTRRRRSTPLLVGGIVALQGSDPGCGQAGRRRGPHQGVRGGGHGGGEVNPAEAAAGADQPPRFGRGGPGGRCAGPRRTSAQRNGSGVYPPEPPFRVIARERAPSPITEPRPPQPWPRSPSPRLADGVGGAMLRADEVEGALANQVACRRLPRPTPARTFSSGSTADRATVMTLRQISVGRASRRFPNHPTRSTTCTGPPSSTNACWTPTRTRPTPTTGASTPGSAKCGPPDTRAQEPRTRVPSP